MRAARLRQSGSWMRSADCAIGTRRILSGGYRLPRRKLAMKRRGRRRRRLCSRIGAGSKARTTSGSFCGKPVGSVFTVGAAGAEGGANAGSLAAAGFAAVSAVGRSGRDATDHHGGGGGICGGGNGVAV